VAWRQRQSLIGIVIAVMTTDKPKAKRAKKKKLDPILCKECKHNMGRSRCKPGPKGWVVRCNKCKTVYDIVITFPKEKVK
jgi:hypothetical protein